MRKTTCNCSQIAYYCCCREKRFLFASEVRDSRTLTKRKRGTRSWTMRPREPDECDDRMPVYRILPMEPRGGVNRPRSPESPTCICRCLREGGGGAQSFQGASRGPPHDSRAGCERHRRNRVDALFMGARRHEAKRGAAEAHGDCVQRECRLAPWLRRKVRVART